MGPQGAHPKPHPHPHPHPNPKPKPKPNPNPNQVPGATSEAALLSYYDFEELADCDAWLAHYLVDEDGFALAAAFEGCNCLKLRRSLDTPTKVP